MVKTLLFADTFTILDENKVIIAFDDEDSVYYGKDSYDNDEYRYLYDILENLARQEFRCIKDGETAELRRFQATQLVYYLLHMVTTRPKIKSSQSYSVPKEYEV